MIVSKAIFGYLRDFHTLLFFVTCSRIVGIMFHSATRRVFYKYNQKRRKIEGLAKIRVIERGKRYVHLVYLCIHIPKRVVLLRLVHLCYFDLSAYKPRVFEFRTF